MAALNVVLALCAMLASLAVVYGVVAGTVNSLPAVARRWFAAATPVGCSPDASVEWDVRPRAYEEDGVACGAVRSAHRLSAEGRAVGLPLKQAMQ